MMTSRNESKLTALQIRFAHSWGGETVADLYERKLENSDLSEINLRHAILLHTNLNGANLQGTDLRFSDLRHADLRHANLAGANLEGACLAGTNAQGACFDNVRLHGTYAGNALLSNTTFRGAELDAACLTNTDLRGSDFRNARIEDTDFALAIWNSDTRWPENFTPLAQCPSRSTTFRRKEAFASDSIRLWTFQPVYLWKRLQQEKTLAIDPLCIDPTYIAAYRWMREQMIARIPGYQGHYPWWAWQYPKPDLRRWRHLRDRSGERCVRIELNVPRSRILLSDYHSWHCVLNYEYLALSDEDDEAWNALVGYSDFEYKRRFPEPWNSQLQKSWDRIFELEQLRASNVWDVNHVQATFEYLHLDDVVEVTEFRRV